MFFDQKSVNVGDLSNPNAMIESMIYEDAMALSDEELKEFLATEAKVLQEKKMLGRRTIVRLSQKDDLRRRTKMAAYHIAKEKKDPLWTKLVKNRVLERKFIRAIIQKYKSQAVRLARLNQREYIKMKRGSKFLDKKQGTK